MTEILSAWSLNNNSINQSQEQTSVKGSTGIPDNAYNFTSHESTGQFFTF